MFTDHQPFQLIARAPYNGRRMPRPRCETVKLLGKLVTNFDAGRLSLAQWNHRTRLVVGLWYVLCDSPTGAREAMRGGIIACDATLYSRIPGGSYHETLTGFYLRMIEAFAKAAPRDLDVAGLAQALLDSELADPRLVYAFYSTERLHGLRARSTFLRPDRQQIQWPPVAAAPLNALTIARAA